VTGSIVGSAAEMTGVIGVAHEVSLAGGDLERQERPTQYPQSRAGNMECLTCHDLDAEVPWADIPRVAFSVEPVDREEVCWKCHWQTVEGHPYHSPNEQSWYRLYCDCHQYGYSRPDWYRLPEVETPGGWFNSATSLDREPSILHAIHAFPESMLDIEWNGRQCWSCHARAACSACHEEDPDLSHGVHGYADAPGEGPVSPWAGRVGEGTPEGDEYVDTTSEGYVSCDVEGCHPRSRMTGLSYKSRYFWVLDPDIYPEHGPWSWTGTWNQLDDYNRRYHEYRTAEAGASMETVFTGGFVEILGRRGPDLGGIVDVYLNGEKVGSFDGYSATEDRAAILWSSGPLAEGEYTLRFVHTGARAAGASASWFRTSGIRYSALAEEFVPTCVSCHEEMAWDHTP
jgi:hypothetical protein